MTNNDLQDIQACLNGNQDAYANLVRRYEQRVRRLMWRFTRDPSQCDELTQDVFVEAYLSLASYKANGPFLNWLWTLATRTGYRFWKLQAKHKTVSLDDYDPPEQLSDKPDPRQAAELLSALLAKLKPPERLILTLHYLEQCSMKDIASRTGWNIAMVKMRAFRARKKLKKIAIEENLLEKLKWTN